jgi:copper resistance protein B
MGTQSAWSEQTNQHGKHQTQEPQKQTVEGPAKNQGMNHSKMKHGDMQDEEMDHENMKHEDMEPGTMKDEPVDHKNMKHEGMNHDEMAGNESDMSGMQHGQMQMQGGEAPANARDPHAYSNGYTLTEGPYAMPKENRLKLADEHPFAAFMADRLEFDDSSNSITYDFQGWYGTTYDRLVVKTEGEISQGEFEENQTDILWGHAVSAFWDAQLGVRLDSYDEGKNRQWLALGLQGLAPYWFELDMTAYLGERGNTALTVEAEYELLLTQKLIFQPRAELSLYGKDDLQNNLGSGLSSSALGFRIRYEINRQLAPYLGIEWVNQYGNTADLARLQGNDSRDTKIIAGLRFWF